MVHNWYFVSGGADKVFFETTRLLERHGHTVIPFSMKDERNYDSPYSNFFVEKIDYSRIRPSPHNLKTALKMIYSFEAKVKIEALIKKTKPNIAHLHNIYGRLTPSILYSLKKFQIPVVLTLHDYKLLCPSYHMTFKEKPCEDCKGGKFYRAILKKCHKNSYLASGVYAIESYLYNLLKTYYKYVDCFIAPSLFIKNKMIDFGLPGNKIEFVPNFISVDNYDSINTTTEDYFLYIGKLIKVKGIFTLLKAVSGIKNTKLYIAGDGELRNEVEEYVTNNKMENVKFLGHLASDEICKVLKRARFIILPSEWYENAPLAILEAFASGKPVIGAKSGGIPEMVVPWETGLLFEPGNHEDLKEKIRYLINNSLKATEMGRNARIKVEKEYNGHVHYQRIMDIYQKLLNSYYSPVKI